MNIAISRRMIFWICQALHNDVDRFTNRINRLINTTNQTIDAINKQINAIKAID